MKAKNAATKDSQKKLVESMLKRDQERRERVLRGEQAIRAICEQERLRLAVPALHLVDGKLVPQIQLLPLD